MLGIPKPSETASQKSSSAGHRGVGETYIMDHSAFCRRLELEQDYVDKRHYEVSLNEELSCVCMIFVLGIRYEVLALIKGKLI